MNPGKLPGQFRRRVPQRRAASLPAVIMAALAWLTPLAVHAADRVALVIGNAEYPGAPLRNPLHDARAMSRALAELGFEVISLENASKQRMEQAILRFADRLQGGTSGLFYYAGHGVQVNGRNYLIPVDAQIESESEVRIKAVGVNLVLDEMTYAGNPMNIVILDACRNNPFQRRLRGGSRGLAAIDVAGGTLIAYATAPGSVAHDGDGANGIYTEELLKALREPGLEVEQVFKRVRVGVARRTDRQQIPWESSSLTGSLVLNTGPMPATAPVHTEANFDGQWIATRSCDAFEEFPAFVERHPATASMGEFTLQWGQPGQPGYQMLSGRVAGDGSLVLNGTVIARAPRLQGRVVPVYVEGNFDGEQFHLEGRFGRRPCSIVLAR